MRHFVTCLASTAALLALCACNSANQETAEQPENDVAASDHSEPESASDDGNSGLPIAISYETTRITHPLREDGYPDYIGVLDQRQSDGATTSNNYAVDVIKVFGPGELKEPMREEYFKRLGIRSLPDDGDYLINFYRYLDREYPDSHEELWDRKYSRNFQSQPWRGEQYPELAQWHKQYATHVDTLAPTSRHERYYTPLIATSPKSSAIIVLTGPTIAHFREASRVLRERAMQRLGEGDIDGAWNDVMACRRIAQLAGQGPALVDATVSHAINGMTHPAIITIADDPRLTEEQVSRFRKELRSLPAAPSVLLAMEPGERYMCLDMVCSMVRDGPKGLHTFVFVAGGGMNRAFEAMLESMLDTGAGEEAIEAATDEMINQLTSDEQRERQLQLLYNAIDWNVVLQTCNEFYDRLQEIARIDDRERRDTQLKELLAQYESLGDFETLADIRQRLPAEQRTEFSRRLAGSLLQLFCDGLPTSVCSQQRRETEDRLADVALALAAYRIDHGGYPRRLTQLADGYVKQLPCDAFSGAPLQYHSREDGYLLYSIGYNRQDEDGNGPNTDGDGDDIAVLVGNVELE